MRSCITGPAKYFLTVPLQKTLILSDFCFINFLIGKLFILRFTIWFDKKNLIFELFIFKISLQSNECIFEDFENFCKTKKFL